MFSTVKLDYKVASHITYNCNKNQYFKNQINKIYIKTKKIVKNVKN